MIATWRTFLVDHQAEWRLPASSRWNFVLHNNYHPHHSNINVLWFQDDEPFPRVVAKIYERPETPNREFSNLERAHALASVPVPKPLYCGFQDGFWMLWMSGVPGCRPRSFQADSLKEVVAAVGDMHRAFRHDSVGATDERHARLVQRPLAALSGFGKASSVVDGCARLAREASVAWLARLPRIPQHGDLYLDNLLFDAGQWYVTDWEIFGEVDLPGYDLFTLLYSALRRGINGPAGTWDPALVSHVPALVDHYREGVALPSGSLGLLLPLALANWFHVQWTDGRRQFANDMYDAMRHYFENTAEWEQIYLGRAST